MAFVRDTTPEMLRDQFRATINPAADYHDVERFLQARWRKLRKRRPVEADVLQVMITDCRGARAMNAAHRAALPRLRWPGL